MISRLRWRAAARLGGRPGAIPDAAGNATLDVPKLEDYVQSSGAGEDDEGSGARVRPRRSEGIAASPVAGASAPGAADVGKDAP
eukprot:5899545-Pyramimonas_sp.AAC.1